MKTLIDHLTTTTGWTSDGTASAYGLNYIPDYIADLNTTSLIIKFPTGHLNKYIQKTISPAITVTGYTDIVFYIWSRNKSKSEFNVIADYDYKINVGGSDYYIPIYPGFNCVEIYANQATVNKIKITALHNDEDYLVISEMNAVKEEYPLDIYSGLKAGIEAEIAATYPNGILIGTTTANSGVQEIKLTADTFLDRFAVIKIVAGAVSETHQIWEFNECSVKFTSLYDGATLLHNYTAANVYLQLPVEFMAMEKEMILPSIMIYGLNSERIWRGAALEEIIDTVTSSGSTIRQEGAIEKHYVNIHCYARHAELMAFLSRCVRHIINRQTLWMNGFYYEINYEGTVSDVDPNQVYDLVPQLIYQIGVEIKEELHTRSTAVLAVTTTIDVHIESQGVITL